MALRPAVISLRQILRLLLLRCRSSRAKDLELLVLRQELDVLHRQVPAARLVAFIAGQIIVLLAGSLVATWSHAWPSVGHFFTTLSASGLTGVLAALAAALLAGGFATMRRVSI